MIRFIQALNNKMFNGANGKKVSSLYNGKYYVIKSNAVAKLNKDLSYSNSIYSEYIVSHIFNILGIESHNTLLGECVYLESDKNRKVVACEDFEYKYSARLYTFGEYLNKVGDSIDDTNNVSFDVINKYGEHIRGFLDWFYKVYAVDTIVSNPDRHQGNYGFLVDKDGNMKIAPVYDNASSLFPQMDDDTRDKIISHDKSEIDLRVYERTKTGIYYNGTKMNYYDYIERTGDSFVLNGYNWLSKIFEEKLPEIEVWLNKQNEIPEKIRKVALILIKERYEKIVKNSLNKWYNSFGNELDKVGK